MIREDLDEQPLFGMVIETLAACVGTRRPEEVLCEGVARMFDGDMATHLALTTTRVDVVSWPAGANAADLFVTDALVAGSRTGAVSVLSRRGASMRARAGETHSTATRAAEAVGVPLTPDGCPRRVLIVVRTCGFTEVQVHDLCTAVPLIAALDRHLQHCRAPRSPVLPVTAAEPGPPAALTSRELEVLELLATGLLASSIATTLGVSTRTVHVHLAHIYRKLETNDRLSAVNKARAVGLIGRYESA